jgi:hypothetical protein
MAVGSATIMGVMVALSGVAHAQEGDGGGGGSAAKYPVPANKVDLLAPIETRLSGRVWLMTQGMEPSKIVGPGEAGPTGIDWSQLDGGLGSPSVSSAVLQSAGAGALVPYRDPAPAFSTNHLVTRDFSSRPYQTEPNIAIDPADPEHIVLGTIDYNFPSMSSYVTYDGGESWDGPFQSPYVLDDQFSGGDPSLAFDRTGSVYMTSISIGEEDFTVGPVAVTQEVSSIAVARSDDGGYSWPVNIPTARSAVSTSGLTPDRFGRLRGDLTIGFLDKPWIAVGPDAKDPTKDVIYVTYTDFETVYEVLWLGEFPTLVPTATKTSIHLVKSTDGGKTWSAPVAVSPVVTESYGQTPGGDAPSELTPKRSVQGSQPTVTPDGTVYVAWVDSTDDEAMKGLGEIDIARSDDSGTTFGAPVTASTFNEIGFRPRTAFFRYWGSEFPQIASGPDGEVYIVYVARPPDNVDDDGNVYLVSSTDKGQTWSRATQLNDDKGSALQFFPSVAVDPDGGVHVMWGDMRDDPAQTRYGIYYTRSLDHGATWGFEDKTLGITTRNTRVTDFASNPNRGFPNGLFLGDYFSIRAASNDDVYMVWADTRLGEYGAPNQKIGFARRKAVPSPEVYLSPATGPGGQQVTLQGFGYQPIMDVFVQLGDSTIAYARTDKNGDFSSRLYMPVTSEGDQQMTAVDQSGNAASTSFYTEYGIGNLRDQNADLAKQLEEIRQLLTSGGGQPAGSPAPSTVP